MRARRTIDLHAAAMWILAAVVTVTGLVRKIFPPERKDIRT